MRSAFEWPCVRIKRTTSIVACLLLCASSLAAQGRPGPRERLPSVPGLRQAIIAAAVKYKIPGVAVAVLQHGQLHALEVYGARDRQTGAPVTPNTVFEAGGLGEPVYAYAVLVLASQGKFNPGAPLTSYSPLPYQRRMDSLSNTPSMEPLYDPALAQITSFRVLDHTSGLPEWARNHHLGLQFRTGEKWSYSNEAYVYLQQVMDHVTGQTFEDFVTSTTLDPAGMARSGFAWRDAFAGDVATGYDRTGAAVTPSHFVQPVATYTFYTTIQDYARFVGGLLATAPSQYAHEGAVTLMLNPAVAVDDAGSFWWGLGVGLEKHADDLFFFSRGDTPGFQAFVIASRQNGSAFVMLVNSSNGFDALPDLLAVALPGEHPMLRSTFLKNP